MKAAMAEAHDGGHHAFSHFGPEANLFDELEGLFRFYGETGSGKVCRYLHDDDEAQPYGREPGTFTPWETLPHDSDLLFYEGLHGAIITEDVDVAQHADLRIGVPRRSTWFGVAETADLDPRTAPPTPAAPARRAAEELCRALGARLALGDARHEAGGFANRHCGERNAT